MGDTRKKVTVEDIARVTGVSRGTVSRAFNQRNDINEDTRLKVLDAARKLNYLPNPNARGLAKGKTECIGIVVPNLLNPFLAEMVSILEISIRESGKSAILGVADQDLLLQEKVLIRMASGQVDGLIITPCEEEQSIQQLNWINKRVPVVSLKQLKGLECDTVMCNDELAVKMVIEHLVGFGHRNIAFVCPETPLYSVRQRQSAYKSAMKSCGCKPIPPLHCVYNDHRDDDSELDSMAEKLLRLREDSSITAVMAYDDIIAMQLMKKLQARGCTVPDDLSLAGVDNTVFNQYAAVPLTSAAADINLLCQSALDLLQNRLDSQQDDQTNNIVLKPALFARNSTRTLQSR